MKCHDIDKIKPLDKLLDEKVREFESGEDRECDKDLDTMIRELGNFEEDEPLKDAGEFAEELPVEEELVERRVFGPKGKSGSSVSRIPEG